MEYENSFTGKRALIWLGVAIAIVIVGQTTNKILIGDAPVVALSSAPPLTGQVAQTIATAASDKSGLSGYTVKDTHYFDANAWAVTTVTPPKGDGDTGTAVLQNVDQFYQVVLGPGTSFPSSTTSGLPADVIQYLNSKGLIYDAAN